MHNTNKEDKTNVNQCITSIFVNSVSVYYCAKNKKSEAKANLIKKDEQEISDISKNQQKRIRNAISMIHFIHKSKLISEILNIKKDKNNIIMITLTLSATQIHSDQEVKKTMLKPFLRWMTEQNKNDIYIWRAERQANYNIHFHIITLGYIEHSIIRTKWNKIQKKKGYIENFKKAQQEKYRKGFKPSKYSKITPKKQYENYKKLIASDYQNPNSTDVKKIDNIEKIEAYLSTYVAKKDKHDYTKLNQEQKHNYNKIISSEWFKNKNALEAMRFKEYCIFGNLYAISHTLAKLKSQKFNREDIPEDVYKTITSNPSFIFKNDYVRYYGLNIYENKKQFKILEQIFAEYITNNI